MRQRDEIRKCSQGWQTAICMGARSASNFLILPNCAFARDVRACPRYLAMQERARQTSGEAAEAIIDEAAELAFNHPHLLLPIELATAMRVRVRDKMLARHEKTRARLRALWSTHE